MRILFCATPGLAHVRPMLPLWQALHRRGHVLAWAGAPETRAAVDAAAPATHWFDVGPGRQAARQALIALWPDAAHQGAQQALLFPRYFGGVMAPAMLDGLLQAMQSFEPQLVVGEVAALAVPLAAHLAGCPHVTHGIGLPPTPGHLAAAADAFAPSWRTQAGAEPPPDAGLHRHLYLDIYPKSLQSPTLLHPAPRLRMRPDDVDSVPTRALADMPVPAVVYLSLGNPLQGSKLWHDAVAALAALPVRLVVEIGPKADPATLGPLPPNVHLERRSPPVKLPAYCRLVVSSGCATLTLAACAHGVPQLVLPQPADLAHANALQRSGVGLAIPVLAAQTAFAIREAALRLLEEPRFTELAHSLAGEIAGMPGAAEAAASIEALAEAFSRQAPPSAPG